MHSSESYLRDLREFFFRIFENFFCYAMFSKKIYIKMKKKLSLRLKRPINKSPILFIIMIHSSPAVLSLYDCNLVISVRSSLSSL